jgi:hypothetical protein
MITRVVRSNVCGVGVGDRSMTTTPIYGPSDRNTQVGSKHGILSRQ